MTAAHQPGAKRVDPRTLTQDEFVARARAVHGDRYDYSRAEYAGIGTKVVVVCQSHGAFTPTPRNHIHNRSGCPGCSGNLPLTIESFTKRAREIHGSLYDYSEVVVTKSRMAVRIICPQHGRFEQTPDDHLNSAAGCPECGRGRTAASSRLTAERFIERARELHAEAGYDYSNVVYVNIMTNVEIVCPVHGAFWQSPNHHLNAQQGCPTCGGTGRHSAESFVVRAREAHGGRYDYRQVEYLNNHTVVIIGCPDHGPFQQLPIHHMKGSGCPTCGESHGERAVRQVLTERGVEFETQWTHPTMMLERRLRADFAVPSQRVLIEFYGDQHRRPVPFGGRRGPTALSQFKDTGARDRAKERWARENGWRVIRLTDPRTVEVELTQAGVISASAA